MIAPDNTTPETVNTEQEDGDTQAQTVADEAMSRATSVVGEQGESERAHGAQDDSGGMADLVDHMNQMVSSGVIDMSAYRGERSDDDEEGMLGEGGIDDDTPRGS
ncbi:MAG: hypothetical protein C0409_06695 [Novosphingobium sp.]|nr:hypothetical protein [Novosphingobium sp.]